MIKAFNTHVTEFKKYIFKMQECRGRICPKLYHGLSSNNEVLSYVVSWNVNIFVLNKTISGKYRFVLFLKERSVPAVG